MDKAGDQNDTLLLLITVKGHGLIQLHTYFT